jgi:hypothetical protein
VYAPSTPSRRRAESVVRRLAQSSTVIIWTRSAIDIIVIAYIIVVRYIVVIDVTGRRRIRRQNGLGARCHRRTRRRR